MLSFFDFVGPDRRAFPTLSAFIYVSWLLMLVLVAGLICYTFIQRAGKWKLTESASILRKFVFATFFKPHTPDTSQQAALESFYKSQADVYDATRKILLHGREEMLGLVAAQMKYKQERGHMTRKPIWVDLGGGTGYNIEAMGAFVDVPNFFSAVILVDLSPSILEVAKKRFQRLDWDVHIVCQDVRTFSLKDLPGKSYLDEVTPATTADLITMSYSLSMIPDYYNVLDHVAALLSPTGLIGVADFYVQSIVEIQGRNYVGGSFNRHVTWLGRLFWRAWFDLDRVGLEGARRDYMEYKFGTLKTIDQRNYWLGGIPFYIFLGVNRQLSHASGSSTQYTRKVVEAVDVACSESPPPSPPLSIAATATRPYQMRTKSCKDAVINLAANIPLPSSFYQNTHKRLHYNDQLPKHTRFNNEYIYTFTWEDPLVDHRILNIRPTDTVLCITSAGDNVLDYILAASPRRIHAVDLNPNQNHLLELKTAALQALPYRQVWKLFGLGRCPDFRSLLVNHLSPHLSSQACQYWLTHSHIFSSRRGLYETGGSRHAIILVRCLFSVLGLTSAVKNLCNAKTLLEQQDLWPRVRRVLLSKPLHWAVVSTEWFCWKAAGVPAAQHAMIVEDYRLATDSRAKSGEAIWEYVVGTLDPVVRGSLLREQNYFYGLCLLGMYTRRCHPRYLSPKAHNILSRPNAFDGLRLHTDELCDVLAGFAPDSLDHVVIMDSMDWFTPSSLSAANTQITLLRTAMKEGGKVLLRSAGRNPWYVRLFEEGGFEAKRVGVRLPGGCMDRVNMYASTWVCVKRKVVEEGALVGM